MKYLALGLMAFISACTNDDVAGGGSPAKEYEIRADIMSHIILSNTLRRTGGDTLEILDKTLDKRASLPGHAIDTNIYEGVKSIFYKAQVEPVEFNAYLQVRTRYKYVDVMRDEFTHRIPPGDLAGASLVLRNELGGAAFFPVPTSEVIYRKVNGVVYAKGKGFYVYDGIFDYAEGDIVIRYR